mmetsp:Transcript_41006/g.118728  ORF Transcript_41006/g.118728 Transcript_41006/m.118728 type:complete len:272 (+) Transcript_41006:114-929(+)
MACCLRLVALVALGLASAWADESDVRGRKAIVRREGAIRRQRPEASERGRPAETAALEQAEVAEDTDGGSGEVLDTLGAEVQDRAADGVGASAAFDRDVGLNPAGLQKKQRRSKPSMQKKQLESEGRAEDAEEAVGDAGARGQEGQGDGDEKQVEAPAGQEGRGQRAAEGASKGSGKEEAEGQGEEQERAEDKEGEGRWQAEADAEADSGADAEADAEADPSAHAAGTESSNAVPNPFARSPLFWAGASDRLWARSHPAVRSAQLQQREGG